MKTRPRIGARILGPALFIAAAAVITLALPGNRVIGDANTDLVKQFLSWRAYAARTLLSGHLPLWNPYTYSGQPFLGGFQSALLYPLNAVFLVLPLNRAANFSMLLHLVILGWGMHRLALRRGFHPAACALCAGLLPLSGAVFPHLFAGHLPNLCSMAWTPWIFAGLEDYYHNRRLQGLLLASAAICLQILAGHVQYVFYTAIAAALQAAVLSLRRPALLRRALPAVAAVYAAAALLSAAQLFPGMTNIRQGIRHAKMGFEFASMFSFPIENLLTFAVPGFFGDLHGHVYWGRGYLWEMSVFVGISGLALAAAGLLDRENRRIVLPDLGMAALLLVLALGDHTPLFGVLYDYVPGFDRFRGISKFTFPATVFLVLAIGAGADAILRGRPPRWTLGLCTLEAGVGAVLAGVGFKAHPWLISGFLSTVHATQESYLPLKQVASSGFIEGAGLQAGAALLAAGLVLVLLGAAIMGTRRFPSLRWAPLVLLPLEMVGFARTHFATADAGKVLPPGLHSYVASHPGDYRVIDAAGIDNGFLLGAPDIWGNDPTPLARYAEFMTYSQGGNPDKPSQLLSFHHLPAVYDMLRLRYAFLPTSSGVRVDEQVAKPMARVQLISDFRVMKGRNAILAALMDSAFDPRRTVLLESIPYPRPQPNDRPGTVRILREAPDYLVIEADAVASTLLLVTDLYSANWHARALPGSVQQLYDVLPANYVLRAIPLAPGHHRILLEYVPGGFRLGLGVSLLAWILWVFYGLRLRRAERLAA